MPISVTRASIAYIGIAAPLMLYGFMQQVALEADRMCYECTIKELLV